MEISGSTTRWGSQSLGLVTCRRVQYRLLDGDETTRIFTPVPAFSGPVPHFLPTSPLGGFGRKIRWVMITKPQVRVGGRWKRRTGRVSVTSRQSDAKKMPCVCELEAGGLASQLQLKPSCMGSRDPEPLDRAQLLLCTRPVTVLLY
jgi:hypothetical protein